MNIRCSTIVVLLTVFLASHLRGQETQLTEETDQNVQSFELVWKTIRDTHWDPSKVGETWKQAHDRMLPKIRSAKDKKVAREVMSELIATLGQSHFAIIPSDSYDAMDVEGGGGANTGITARLINNEAVVTAVREKSSAAVAGIKPGWTIVKIRNTDLSNLIAKLKDRESQGPERLETTAGMVYQKLLSGSKGEKIAVEFQTPANESRLIKLKCSIPANAKMAKFGHLPTIQVDHETRTLDGQVGYYRFSAFLDPVRIMPSFRSAIRDENHNNGLIIDLRGNIGGMAAMTMGMAGEFAKKKLVFGTMTSKDSEFNFMAFPKANPISGPTAILVDECSISSAEILAGGLQDVGIAKVFGTRTAGLALPSQVIKLPNGDGFQFAMADYHSASGKSLEKDGVTPDFSVELTKENIASEGDPTLNAALDWIQGQNSK